MRFETKAIHAGQEPDPQTGAVVVPVNQATTFRQDGIGQNRGFEYSRTGNPTRAALETSLASLENGKYGSAFSSGSAASSAVLRMLAPGDQVLSGSDIYGGTYRLFERVYRPNGISVGYGDVGSIASFERQLTDRTKIVWIETPTNPLLSIADIEAFAVFARKHSLLLVVDNTFATPYFQRPLDLGAHVVVQSTTKYLGGHSDVVGGAVITNDGSVHEKVKFIQNAEGAVPGPWDCWLVLRGIKTLAVRMREHEKNAWAVAKFLDADPKVEKVFYPGLSSHPGHEIARRQMTGFGGMVSFEFKEGSIDIPSFFKRLKIFSFAESLGAVESLACYPPQMTHASIPAEERAKKGIRDTLVRLSVGLENSEDLIEDLKQAMR